MSVVEIILIIAGVVICILGYLMPARKEDMDETLQLISEDEVRKVVDKEVGEAKAHIADIIDETVSYAMEKTERSMERVTNEKIMAVNEYSDTVLEEINKNHKEVLFLYDMLNDKHDNLKDTVSEASKTAEEIKQTVRDAEITARETQESVKEVENSVREAEDAVRAVMTAALEAHESSVMPAYSEISAKEEVRAAGGAYREYRRESHDTGVAEYGAVIPDIGIPEFEKDVPDIGVPEFEEEEIDTAEIETEKESAYAEAMEVARAAAYTGIADDARDMAYDEIPHTREDDRFVPIAPPRVEIIHDPDGEYDYIAEPPQIEEPIPMMQERTTENRPVNIPFTNLSNGKNNGRNSNERILELHKAGKSNMAIAKELGLGMGEVKLVIDLFEGL